MMAKTQVSLEPELQRQARQRAAQLGVSFAKYVRTLVANDLGHPRRRSNPSVVFNLGSSDGSDVRRRKDAMIGEAIAAERNRRRGRH
jgi:hypothetical protein